MERLTIKERFALFHTLRRMQLRHWPLDRPWVELRHPYGIARLYRNGSYDLLP